MSTGTSARTTPQELVEHALAASTADNCLVLLEETTEANLRWANNTLTTNGVMHRIDATVVSFAATGLSGPEPEVVINDGATPLPAR